MPNIYSSSKPAGLYEARKSVTPPVRGIVLAIRLGNDYSPASGKMPERFIGNVYVQMAVTEEGAAQYIKNINTLTNSSEKIKESLDGGSYYRRTNQKVRDMLSWVGTPEEILQKRREFHLLRQSDRALDISEAQPGSRESRYLQLNGNISDYERNQISKYMESFDMSRFKAGSSRKVAENLRAVFLNYGVPIECTNLITFTVPFMLNEYGCDKHLKSSTAIGYKNGVLPVYNATDDDWVSSYSFMCVKSFREEHGNLVGEILEERAQIEDMLWEVIPVLDFVSFSAMVTPMTPIGKQKIQQIPISTGEPGLVVGPGRVAAQVAAFKKKHPNLLASPNVPKQLASSVPVKVQSVVPQKVSPSIPKNDVSGSKQQEESNVSNKEKPNENVSSVSAFGEGSTAGSL